MEGGGGGGGETDCVLRGPSKRGSARHVRRRCAPARWRPSDRPKAAKRSRVHRRRMPTAHADGACRRHMPTASPRCRCGIGEPSPSAGVGAQRMWQASADIPEAAWCGPIYISINLYIYLYLYIYIYLSICKRTHNSRRTGSPRCLRYAHTPRRHSASLHAAAPECSEMPPLTLTEYASTG